MRNINLYVLYLVLPVFIFGFAIGRDYQQRVQPDAPMRHTIIFQSCYIDHWWPDSLDVEGVELKRLYDDLPRRREETRERMKNKMLGI